MYFFVLLGAICRIALGGQDEGRIVGGKEVSIFDYPHQVSLFFNGRFICGGSVINTEYIITAGHCSNFLIEDDLTIHAGLNNIYDVIRSESVTVNVSKIMVHPNFTVSTSGGVQNDIAIVKVSPPLPLNHRVRPIGIGFKEPQPGDFVTVTGYGTTSEGGSVSGHLLGISVPIVDKDECSKVYAKYGNFEMTKAVFCAGYPKGKKDSCQGDSGGPVVFNGNLVGIVSYGLGCARPNIPGVYTNIANYHYWIYESLVN